jgi:hypothetical protein
MSAFADLHLVAHGLDLGDRAHVDAEHPHAVALVQADGAGEVRGQVVAAGVLEGPPDPAGDDEREHDRDGEAPGQGLSEAGVTHFV